MYPDNGPQKKILHAKDFLDEGWILDYSDALLPMETEKEYEEAMFILKFVKVDGKRVTTHMNLSYERTTGAAREIVDTCRYAGLEDRWIPSEVKRLAK